MIGTYSVLIFSEVEVEERGTTVTSHILTHVTRIPALVRRTYVNN
jgi:hypothetical protein